MQRFGKCIVVDSNVIDSNIVDSNVVDSDGISKCIVVDPNRIARDIHQMWCTKCMLCSAL